VKNRVIHILIAIFIVFNTICAKEIILNPIGFYIIRNGKNISEVEKNSILIRNANNGELILTVDYCNNTLFFEYEKIINFLTDDSIPDKLLMEFFVKEKSECHFYQICVLKGKIRNYMDSQSAMSLSIFDFAKTKNIKEKHKWLNNLDDHISEELKEKIKYCYDFYGGGYITIPHIPFNLLTKDEKGFYPFGMIPINKIYK
jgi:hypothetical protein